ncbi:VCBS repeat-containing protein [Candidatus Marifrigoribacter sp. Uisw_064]|jgi:hypothetical protein|uniref:VCBS repeat-containing protein n=1 Tax=Candidatus Marifrigoribacter sp. Uisw_064 TaxID=3230970 RepID=UPI003ADC6498
MKYSLSFLFLLLIITSCKNESLKQPKNGVYTNDATHLFTKINKEKSSITFKNTVTPTKQFNFMSYPYLYAGAGLALGDIDNDGLEDIYFVGNNSPNKLYKNEGDFKFKDITVSSKTEDYNGFSTGVTMLDINNDGWLDIYVLKAGSLGNDEGRKNLLFVNQKNGTFYEESKKWGLDDPGFGTQAYSLDYDNDGDLDIYIVNYRYDFTNNGRVSAEIQNNIQETTSDQLYRNDGTIFTKVTGEAGLYNKAWGLSASIGDFNNDGWEDIYVANDFNEPDAMYINQKDGTFNNEILTRLNHISFNSMGTDFADLNNDSFEDLITLDMAAEDYERSKINMASMDSKGFKNLVNAGYHYPYMTNMLFYNEGNGKFKETGQLSGITNTDWSWAPLITDFDNDGMKDIFISNGVYKDYHNQDFRNLVKYNFENKIAMSLEKVMDLIPSVKQKNYMFQNEGNLSFKKVISDWGLDEPTFSNGSAYADLDNDGDLDLVTNNFNHNASLYRNNANVNYLQVDLKGPSNNSLGLGTEVFVKNKTETQFQKLYITRGYFSSVTNILNFGLGENESVDEVIVKWPDGKTSKQLNVKANQRLVVDYASATNVAYTKEQVKSNTQHINNSSLGIDFQHKENEFEDYSLQLLIPQKQSTKGSGITVADVNKDGLEDFFVGNAAGASAALYIQNNDGTFKKSNESLWNKERKYEDANALFFDADQDGDQDLYVVSAGYELKENSPLLQDRLYLNNGAGNFTRKNNALPTMLVSGKDINAGDYDKDGDLDLFVGGNVIPGKYPLAPKSYLLKNNNGVFSDDTKNSPDLSNIGMVSQSIFTDYDNDNDLDLMVVGEWMAPTLFTNTNGSFEKNEKGNGLENNEGWWFSITAGDFDNDGDQDYVAGNIGGNNKFHPTTEKPLFIYAKDFDDNGSFDVAMSKINDGKRVPIRGKECSSEQNPFLLEKIGSFKEFASLDMEHIYGEEKLNDAFQLAAHNFKSSYIENLGDGTFKMKPLLNEAQTGPTTSLISKDINNDGILDIIGVGGLYDAEIETIRYDSNYGYVLLGDGKGNFSYSKEYYPFIDNDAKDIKNLNINGKEHYIVVSNNAPLKVFNYSL